MKSDRLIVEALWELIKPFGPKEGTKSGCDAFHFLWLQLLNDLSPWIRLALSASVSFAGRVSLPVTLMENPIPSVVRIFHLRTGAGMREKITLKRLIKSMP